ncbi:MAG TPA: hypothetical protein DEF41_11225 [Desulfovibrio sp.]|nr:hypothetical protein [Desulfovibrio sp.]
MGRYLQIRVSASTFREEEVLRAWPRLTALVWPDGPVGPEGGGVLQLVAALDDACNFAGWNDTLRKALGQGIERAAVLKANLEEALGEWNAREANRLSDELEAALDELERLAPAS